MEISPIEIRSHYVSSSPNFIVYWLLWHKASVVLKYIKMEYVEGHIMAVCSLREGTADFQHIKNSQELAHHQ